MAEIPLERKSPVPWWVWLIAALLIVAILWWIIDEANEPDDVAVLAPVAEVMPVVPPVATATNAEITDPVVIVAVTDRRPLIGRTVRLTNVRVLDVIGDQAFWIGSGPDQRVLVAMKEVLPPGTPTDADININAGQTINLIGQVRALPALTGAARTTVDAVFGPAFATAAEQEQIYIFARTAQVVAQP